MSKSKICRVKSLILALTFSLTPLTLAGGATFYAQPTIAAANNWYDNENTFFDRAKLGYNAGQFDQALKDLTDAIRINPHRADFYYWRSLCFSAIKQNDQALSDLDEAIKLDPESATVYLNRGLLHSNLNHYQLAIADFDQALKLDPSLTEAGQNRDFCVKELAKGQSADLNKVGSGQAAAVASVDMTIAPTSATASGAMGYDANHAAFASGYHPYVGRGDARLIAMQKKEKDTQEKLLAMKAQAEKIEAEKARAEAQNRELVKKEKDAEVALERERVKRAELDKRKLALVGDSGRQPQAVSAAHLDSVGTAAAAAVVTKPVVADTVKETDDALEIVNRPVRDKWALIVGISNFQDSKLNLHYPAKDAQDFYEFLTKEGNFAKDHVKLLVNEQATRANILSDLGVKWLPHVANPDDLVLIYISSHGSPSEMDSGGVNYLIAYDTDIDNLLSSGLPMQDLSRTIKARVHSDRVVVVLDACHSGAAEAGGKGLVRKGNVDADIVAQGTGQLVITSSDTEQVSWESKKYENSVFTRCLIEALRKNGNATTLGEAFQAMKDQVQSQVLRERGVLQTPVLKSKWKGSDLRLSTPPASPSPGL